MYELGYISSAIALLAAVGNVRAAAVSYNTTASHIDWKDCSPDQANQLRCANFSVPMDWSAPNGKMITLGMAMIPAANQSQRIGYLLFNPGGPGFGPVSPFIENGLGFRSSKLHQYFDIVGPDPRGTDTSTPIQCNPDTWNIRVNQFPQTEPDFRQMVDAYTAMGQSCAQEYGEMLDFVDTASVARDFEAIRIALGDEPMTYFGFSYGSQLGSQYAELFPDNIRAMALDGILDHTQNEIFSLQTETSGYEAVVNKFFEWCRSDTSCALHNETDLPSAFDAFITRANVSPIPAPSCQTQCRANVTGYELLRILQGAISFPYAGELGLPGWSGISAGLAEAMYNNNASAFSQQLYHDKFNEDFIYVAITCQDWLRSNWSFTDFKLKSVMGEIVAPHTRGQGENWFLQAHCMNWPAPVTNPPHSVAPAFANRTLKTPILMTNSFYDDETAYPWALDLARQFGDQNAILVSRNGSGHTSYSHEGATHDTIDEYLINLKLPVPGTILND